MSVLPRNYAERAGETVEIAAMAIEERLASMCESPIETIFLVTFKLFTGMTGNPTHTLVNGVPLSTEQRSWFIEPQFKIGGYRVDFAVGAWPKAPGSLLIVECDGHDFHERTKEQAARDRQRDRNLQAQGHKVFRFTGMEIHRDAFVCALEVFREMVKLETA